MMSRDVMRCHVMVSCESCMMSRDELRAEV